MQNPKNKHNTKKAKKKKQKKTPRTTPPTTTNNSNYPPTTINKQQEQMQQQQQKVSEKSTAGDWTLDWQQRRFGFFFENGFWYHVLMQRDFNEKKFKKRKRTRSNNNNNDNNKILIFLPVVGYNTNLTSKLCKLQKKLESQSPTCKSNTAGTMMIS